MINNRESRSSRRQFLKTAAVGTAAVVAAPAVVTAKKADTLPVIGTGDHRYEVIHNWPQLPAEFKWQTTHNVAVDSEGLVYVIHQGFMDQPDHPTIFVFDADGRYVRSFGHQFAGGGHGLEIRNEGGQDFLYVCAYQQQRSFAKLDTQGELIWRKGAPMESGVYADGEDKFPRPKSDNPWGRDRFIPTNIAFLPDGGFFLIDGYGAYRVHRYDGDANWVSTFGEPGRDADRTDGTFKLPHGIWIDNRGEEPLVVVADREFDRLQWFSLDGRHVETQDKFRWPANVDAHGELLLVPELVARVTLLGPDNEVVAYLGEDSDRIQKEFRDTGAFQIRNDESKWLPGKFVHPHDACFDANGNIYVAEWVATGRVSKLRRV